MSTSASAVIFAPFAFAEKRLMILPIEKTYHSAYTAAMKHYKPKEERKEVVLPVRLTAAQYGAFKQAARKEQRSVSDWLRRLADARVA